MHKKLILATIAMFVLVLPVIMAATTLTTPVSYGNYTKSLTVTVTVDANGGNNMTNVSCYYNASGGPTTNNATYRLFNDILNTTSYQTVFTGTASLTTEGRIYNVSCLVQNRTSLNTTLSSNNVTIDGTNPTVSLALYRPSADVNGLQKLTWTSSDALSLLLSTSVGVDAPGSCPTQNFTSSSGTDQVIQSTTMACDGTYTVTVTGTDYSGNAGTTSSTFSAYTPGKRAAGTQTSTSSSSTSTTNVAPSSGGISTGLIVILVIIGIIYFATKKR